MNKVEQRKLLSEIMEADEKDGLYKTNNMAQTFDEAQHIKDSFSIEQIKEMWNSAIPNNMEQQTAVSWLIDQLRQLAHNPETRGQEWGEAFEQAKQMEKEQIVNAWMATDNELQRLAAEQYYNETYGK